MCMMWFGLTATLALAAATMVAGANALFEVEGSMNSPVTSWPPRTEAVIPINVT